MKRIGINYKPLRLALSHRNTVSRLLFLTLFLFSFIGGAMADKPAPRRTAPTFTKDIIGYGDSEGGWYLIAFPIGEVSPHNVDNLLSDDYDLYEFDQSENGKEWHNYKPNNFNLFPGKGYLYANSGDVTLTFTGTPYNGDGIIELKKSDGAHFEGWNLIGNPFSVEAIIDCDFYVMNADGTEIIAAESNTVGPMEGIFVIAGEKGESVTFTPTDDESNARSASLALNLSRGSVSPGSTRGTIDRVIVRFGEGRMLPKFQLNPNHTKVYIPMDGKDYAVVRSKGVDEMPVNFKADTNGSYTLSVSTEEVSFGYLHLIDSKTGNDIDLLETPSYTFEASTTDEASRFKLVYAQDGNTKPNTLADVKRSPTRGMDNVPILPSHGEEGNQPAWEDDNGGEGGEEGGDDPQPTTYDLTVESFENLELITFVNNEMQMEGDGTIQVEEGAQVMLSIIANVGYVIKTLMVNGENHADDIGDDFTYTFEMPDEGVTISATAEFTPDPNKLYFDTEGSGWEMGDRDKVGFYVFRPGVEFIYGWGSKKLQGTKVEGQDGIWEFDPTKASLNLEQDTQYQIIFVRVSNNNWGDQAYPLVMGTDCLGSIAYCDGTTYEDPVDNSKESLAAFWKEIDASVYGPIIQITSTGNVVGTCYFEGSNGFSILCDFLNDADKIATAREKSGKSDQEIVDNIGTNLGLTKQDVYDAIADTGSDIVWDYNVSTLPGDVVVHFSNDGDIYTIHDAEGWEIFCKFIEGGESFSGKTVELGTNIEVSRCAGSGTDQEHAMNEHPFCGTFDGDGKTLTFNYGSSGTPANEDYIAPFRFVNGATIQHLHVSGDIYTQHTHSAGIVGLAYGTSNITDCRSSVNIHSSINGDGTHGGIMSCSWTSSTTNIEGCLFDGSIQSVGENVTTHSCGGFVGWKNATINVTNSLLAADLSTIGSTDSYTFVRRSATIANSYYTSALGTEQGKAPHTVTPGDNVTIEAVSPVGEPVENGTYSVSGITAYAKGITRTVGDVTTFYYGAGDQVSLTLSNTATAPTGYQYSGYSASAGTLSGNDTDGWTLTMPDEDVTISATAVEVAASVVSQTIQLSEGWNWFSTNVEISLDDLKNALIETLPGANGITIYSMSNQSITYSSVRSRWIGTLPSLDVAQMYMIKVPADCEITLEGLPIDPADHPVTINQGDNWIAFPLNVPMTVAEAFTGFAVSGDIISSQTAFAVYTENGWRGTLRSLEPGQGYIYKSADDEERVLIFPTPNSARRVSRSRSIQHGTHWSFDFHAYQFNQPVVATIQIGGLTIASDGNWEDLEIAAFVGDECRGSALMRYEFVDEIPVVELPVYYNNSNEEVTFKLYDHVTCIEYDVCPNNAIKTGTEHVELYMGSDEFVSLYFSRVELADDGTNDDLINAYAGKTVNVTLQGRKLYKDGAWNTLCLPFNLGDAYADDGHYFDDTPLEGATVMELDIDGDYSGKHTGFDPNKDGGTLYLYFKDATSIESGKPYIVKWTKPDGYDDNPSDFDISDPVFSGVTVSSTAPTGVTLTDGKYIVSAENDGLNKVQFIGSYSPVTLTGGDTSNLYLGTGIDDKGTEDTSDDVTCSKLYYPNTDKTLNACRAYFHVEFDEPGQEARRIVLNYGDGAESTGIVEITDPKPAPAGAGSWYSLDGRRLSGKPTTKGVYINNGRKVVIK